MKDSIVKLISIPLLKSNDDKTAIISEAIQSVPAGYQIETTQIIPSGNPKEYCSLLIIFSQIDSNEALGSIHPNLGVPTMTGNVPTQKQLSYLAKLVDAIQPEDFPGLDEIKTKKLAGQWIAKLTKIQKENRGA